MVKCKSDYDCFYSPSIRYCELKDHGADQEEGGGECEWTWGFWTAIGMAVFTAGLICTMCLICLIRRLCCVRNKINEL